MATRIEKTDLARDALYDKVNTMIDEVNTKIDNKDSLPSQTGNAGKFLTTDGTNASWGEVKQIEIKQDLTNPSPDTVPSTKAVKDESSRITTLMNTKVSNCITYIPQDIKLELNNGTLTLKAGSKVYVPNGAGVFDEIIIASDITKTWNGDSVGMLFVNANNPKDIGAYFVSSCVSGATAPTLSSTYGYWYDTTNNLIKLTSDKGSSWFGKYSFPICIITANAIQITSIDQVFNGFGYIGSTIFALPGVKGLIPNGRNADGSLKSIEFNLNEVHTATFNGTTNYTTLTLSASGWIGESIFYSYAEDINYNIWGGDKSDVQHGVLFGNCKLSSGAISNFSTKTPFHALDYNDKSTISGWSMPSDKYINLTLGADGSTYTAPANGILTLRGQTTSTGKAYGITNNANGCTNLIRVDNLGQDFGVFMLAQKGQPLKVIYEGSLASGYIFRFIFAEGEN